jgi:hypothetical protein
MMETVALVTFFFVALLLAYLYLRCRKEGR